jgi:hypothetical protein
VDTDFVIITGKITQVGINPVSINFKTPNADTDKAAILLLDRRKVREDMPLELNGEEVRNGVRQNDSNDFHGQTSLVRSGTLRSGAEDNVLTMAASVFLDTFQVDNVVLLYKTK